MADAPKFDPTRPFQPAGQTAAPTFDPSKPYQAAAPTLQERTAGALGTDPNMKDRPLLWPLKVSPAGEGSDKLLTNPKTGESLDLVWPQIAVDAAEAFMAPGHVKEGGDVTARDALNFSLMTAVPGVARRTPAGTPRAPAAQTTEELKAGGSKLFEQAVKSGDAIAPDPFLDFMIRAEEHLKSQGAPAKKLHDKLRSVWKIMLGKLGDKPLSVQDALIIRRQLGVAASGVSKELEHERGLAVAIQEMLDDTMEAATRQNGVLASAREVWARGMKSQTIEEAMERAQLTASGYENGLRIEFRKILGDKKRLRGFTADEISAMKEVVRGSIGRQAMRILSALGFKISPQGPGNVVGGAIGQGGAYALGNSVAGPPGGFAAMAGAQGISMLAQKAAASSTERAALRARNLAASGGRFPRNPSRGMNTARAGFPLGNSAFTGQQQ